MNWGYKIIVVYIVFISGILLLVFKSSSQNQDLVASDYYEQELKYQDRIEQVKRADALSVPVTYHLQNGILLVKFPAEMSNLPVNASVLLYCVADQAKDLHFSLHTDNGQTQIAIPAVNHGLHELQVTWVAGKESYFDKQKIMLP
ncbi:MAG: FixH family protein [Ferruginibacter sp.]|nr:FixH family protein [Ferruginibacter sp.]